MTYTEIDEAKLEQVKEFGVEALFTDGGHHKQWYIEEMLKLLGVDLEEMRIEQLREGWLNWEEGIAP